MSGSGLICINCRYPARQTVKNCGSPRATATAITFVLGGLAIARSRRGDVQKVMIPALTGTAAAGGKQERTARIGGSATGHRFRALWDPFTEL